MVILILIILFILIAILLWRDYLWRRECEGFKDVSTKNVTYKGDRISYYDSGDSKKEEVLVFMSGLGEISPIYEFKPIISKLEKRYRCILIEICVYGCSSITKRKRTVDEIANEIDAVINHLKLNQFTFVCHSISGIYALYYSNIHKGKVSKFIGIDETVSRQAENRKAVPLSILLYWKFRALRHIGLYRSMYKNAYFSYPNSSEYTWTDEDKKKYSYLKSCNISNKNIMSETYTIKNNFEITKDMKYHIPTLQLISEESIRTLPNWLENHQVIVEADVPNILKRMNGSHYLHHDNPIKVCNEIVDFISNNSQHSKV
ncbi:alpha/beta hydrolase [[Clostridium] innocuum]|nr:alpha/beta hydrolase [[Clostridium] innocuum]